MRLYIPLVVSDLLKSSLVDGTDTVVLPDSRGEKPEQVEDAAELALAEAAFISLERCVDLGAPPARLVAVASARGRRQGAQGDGTGVKRAAGGAAGSARLPGGGSPAGETQQVDGAARIPWNDVESIMADGAKARSLVGQIASSDSQEEVDLLVQELFEVPLSWYDVSERDALALELSADKGPEDGSGSADA